MRAEFTDDLITGNELIDSQHEELIGRINKLLDSCEAGEGKISAIKMLDYLAKYTDTHFGDEEALQKEVCYPDYDKHHAKHEEFKQTIQELNEMLQEDKNFNLFFDKNSISLFCTKQVRVLCRICFFSISYHILFLL